MDEPNLFGPDKIEKGERLGHCRSCGDPIVWRKTPRGKLIPMNVEGNVVTGTHFATCPNAGTHRKARA